MADGSIYPAWRRLPVFRSRRLANHCGAQRRSIPRREVIKIMKRFALSITVTAILATFTAPTSAADPTTHLKSEIDTARSESGCPPLQLDPVLNDVSQRIAREVDDYVRHAARTFPTTGEVDVLSSGRGGLLRVLRESGINTDKAKLLNGYGDYRIGGTGDNEAKAIKTTVLQGLGFEVLPDCTYTRYGLSAINDDSNEGWPSTAPRTYAVTTVVLAGP